jgi:hypothetical protein
MNMMTISRRTNRQFVNKLVKNRLFLLGVLGLSVVTLILVLNRSYEYAIAHEYKEYSRHGLQQNIRDLSVCFDSPDDRLCYPKLATISRQLDYLPEENREEAQLRGITHAWLDSHAMALHPKLHDRVVRWASLKGYVFGDFDSSPEGVKLFQSELRSQFNQKVSHFKAKIGDK